MSVRALGARTAALTVAASMVGTGVFTTTGYLVGDTGSPGAVLIGWALGGVCALSGALCYAELGASYPDNGGEYALLSRVWHPALGFVAAVVSVVVGFGAALAAAGLAFGEYLRAAYPQLPLDERALATMLIAACTAAHLGRVRLGAAALDGVTVVQMATVVVVAAVGLSTADPRLLLEGPPLHVALASPGFAVGLVYIGFTYAGWNAAAYVAGEIEDPARALPRGLLLGTGFVTVLYLALNAAILMSAHPMVLAGQLRVAHLAATIAAGPAAARALSVVIAFGLVGSALAFLLTGSRVIEAVGADWARLRFAVRTAPDRGPAVALVALAVLATGLAWTAAFRPLLEWIGLLLSLMAALTVLGVPLSRWRDPDRPRPFRVPGGLAVPALFVVPTAWSIAHSVWQHPASGAAAAAVLVAGGLGWLGVRGAPRR